MVTYYISYGEPPRRFPRWLPYLAIPAALLAVSIAAAVLWLLPDAESDDVDAAVPPPARFNAAIAQVYRPETTTIFLVDASGSIADSGNLESLRHALASLALDNISRLDAISENTRVGLTTFDTDPQSVIPPAPLDGDAARQRWLLQAGHLQTGVSGGSFIYDAVSQTHRHLLDADNGGGPAPVIILLSDGIDGAVGQCRPAAPGTTTEYCVGPGDDPLPCADLPAVSGGGVTQICDAISSAIDPYDLLDELAASAEERNLTVHAIGYGRPSDHEWLRRAAQATGGQYIRAGQ